MLVPDTLRHAMLRHAIAQSPLESCGLLGGVGNEARRFYPTRNAAASPVRYEVEPKDLLETTIAIDEAGMQLWGIFHSHPATEAYPSQTDIRLAYYPDAYYLIASLKGLHAADGAGAELRAFRITGTRVDEVEIASV